MSTQRGPYAKGKAKRAEILDTALEVIYREGYSGATVKQLAGAVGLSQNGLLRYFGSKDALFVEVLRRHDEALERATDLSSPGFADRLASGILNSITADMGVSGLSQLTLRLSGEATESDHVAHNFFHERYAGTRALITAALQELRDRDKLRSDIDPEILGNLIFASIDGLRLQWMYESSIDVHEHIACLLRALGVDDHVDDHVDGRQERAGRSE